MSKILFIVFTVWGIWLASETIKLSDVKGCHCESNIDNSRGINSSFHRVCNRAR
jgi:hypothetical protein